MEITESEQKLIKKFYNNTPMTTIRIKAFEHIRGQLMHDEYDNAVSDLLDHSIFVPPNGLSDKETVQFYKLVTRIQQHKKHNNNIRGVIAERKNTLVG